jgi:hypothetical protein
MRPTVLPLVLRIDTGDPPWLSGLFWRTQIEIESIDIPEELP